MRNPAIRIWLPATPQHGERLPVAPEGVTRICSVFAPGSSSPGGLAKDILAGLGKRPGPTGWAVPAITRIEDARTWLLAHGVDELWIVDFERYFHADVSALVGLLAKTPCAVYLCTNDEDGCSDYQPRQPPEVQQVERLNISPSWIDSFLDARSRILEQMTQEHGETADLCMRNGFDAALSLSKVFWEKPNREHLFAALIAGNTPARQTLRTVSAQCALLQQGYLVTVAGNPSTESVLVDGRVAGERVARMANPDRAVAATLELLPLPGAILNRLTVGALVREERGEVSVCGYLFSGHLAAALLAACLDGDRPRDDEELLLGRRRVSRMAAAKAPLSTRGLQVKFTALSDVSDRNRNLLVNRCAVVSALAQCGWTRTVSIADIPARSKAAQDLVADGLLQEIDASHFSSTRALRFNQFALH